MFECSVIVIFILYAQFLESLIGLPTLALVAAMLVMSLRAVRGYCVFVRGIIALLVLVFGPLIILMTGSLINELVNTRSFCYRLTLDVETPTGVKSGSSVIRISYTPHLILLDLSASGFSSNARGEAIYLDLGQGKNIVATLAFGPNGADSYRIERLPALAFHRDDGKYFEEASTWKGRRKLLGKDIPTLVTFSDTADPTTLHVVPPDQFEEIFGPGYRFKGMWLEMTKDRVTDNNIEKKLPWLLALKQDTSNMTQQDKQSYQDYRSMLYRIYQGIFHLDTRSFCRNCL